MGMNEGELIGMIESMTNDNGDDDDCVGDSYQVPCVNRTANSIIKNI